MKFTFQVHNYDRDGDMVEEGIFLDIGTVILKFDGVTDLEDFAKEIIRCLPEIKENL